MDILYCSTLVSKRILDKLYEESKIKPLYSIQKFHRLVVEGLVSNNQKVEVLSSMPVSPQSQTRKIWFIKNDFSCGIKYSYIPFFNIRILRQISIFLFSFFYTLCWGIKRKKEKRVVCDVLNISICLGSLLASKLVGIKVTAIVTDMPGLMVSVKNTNIIQRFITQINKSYLGFFDYYVLLTSQMNPVLNIKKRPYIVMEGLVDINMKQVEKTYLYNSSRNIIYAGGLHERYGIKMLLDAFVSIPMQNISLSIYGKGPMEADLLLYEAKDKRIHFFGVVPNEVVVEEELKATLLVNPRPTNEEFTKYSFPSKNMEYMVSGTPLLTTNLPGMPKEYHKYIYLFDEETTEGYRKRLIEVLSLPEDELIEKGNKAKMFVLNNKNNIKQSRRIIELIK